MHFRQVNSSSSPTSSCKAYGSRFNFILFLETFISSHILYSKPFDAISLTHATTTLMTKRRSTKNNEKKKQHKKIDINKRARGAICLVNVIQVVLLFDAFCDESAQLAWLLLMNTRTCNRRVECHKTVNACEIIKIQNNNKEAKKYVKEKKRTKAAVAFMLETELQQH